MFKSKKIICIFFAIFPLNFCYLQVDCLASESMKYEITNWISTSNKIQNLSFSVKSSDPTVFYIDSIKINDVVSVDLVRSYWEIECSANDLNLENLDLFIYGTGLSSADTMTQLKITDIIFDENIAEDTTIIVIFKNEYHHSFVRFAKIINVYPAPLIYEEDLNIDFSIDIPMDISFSVFDATGRIVEKYEIRNAEKGRQIFKINFKNRIASGRYWIFLETNTGNDSRSFTKVN